MYLGLKVPATLLTVSYATSKVVCFRKSYSNGVTKLLQKSLSSRRSCRGLDFWQTQCKNPQTRARVVQRSSFRFFNNQYDFGGAFSMTRRTWFLSCVITLLTISIVVLVGCQRLQPSASFEPEVLPLPQQLTTFEPMTVPPDNPMTPEKVALGRQLFFDERLSGDGSKSCYSCHVCEKGLTDGLSKSLGAFNKQLPRSSPTLWNIGYHKEFYWDGRSGSLEKQAMAA